MPNEQLKNGRERIIRDAQGVAVKHLKVVGRTQVVIATQFLI